MIKEHMRNHGQTYTEHFKNNWYFTKLALKAAFYTFGHGIVPKISGRRATELHNELWDEGRKLSLEDLKHRLENGLYENKAHAMRDYTGYASLYNEVALLTPYVEVINKHYDQR